MSYIVKQLKSDKITFVDVALAAIILIGLLYLGKLAADRVYENTGFYTCETSKAEVGALTCMPT